MRKPLRVECGHEGCSKIANFEAASRAEQHQLWRKYGNGRWRCIRHERPDELLSITNRKRTFDIVSDQREHGIYWGNSGFMHGPGFMAFSQDFPAGTRLIVTAEIVLPEGDQQ